MLGHVHARSTTTPRRGPRETVGELWLKSGKTPQKIALRARIVLPGGEGVANHAIAGRLGTSRPTVLLWRQRFERSGVSGLLKEEEPTGAQEDDLSGDHPAGCRDDHAHETAGATHWSTRTLGKALKLSRMTVQRIWRQHDLQPHRVEKFKLSRDPHFVEKLRDVVGLYLDIPRTRPSFSPLMRRARSRLWIERRLCCRCGPGSPNDKPTTTSATELLTSTLPFPCLTAA